MSKLVLADYFLGFSTRAVSGGARPWRLYYESEEEAGLKPPRCSAAFSGDLYVNDDIKEIASTYYPAIGPYDLEDPDVAEYHVLLAKSAGIDGFMAEFTMGQEAKLLSLVNAARKHDFKVGVNWISQSHFAENLWPDRVAAMAKAHELVRWMAEHVYKPCGVKFHDRYLLLVFLAHPREPSKPLDPFFSPAEVRALKQTAIEAGVDANFLVLPWEKLPDLPDGASGQRVWDGYFPWVWSSSGAPDSDDTCWSRVTTRPHYIQRLRDYYAMCRRLQEQGRIGMHIGAVLPGFDDHKGQAWGEGLKRYLPRDDGQTLDDTWAELKQSNVDAAMIITWNDWVESSQIEPSLERGDTELIACAKHIAEWKSRNFNDELIEFPRRLLDARRLEAMCANSGAPVSQLASINEALDQTARAIAAYDSPAATKSLERAQLLLKELAGTITTTEIHLFWEFGFASAGLRLAATGEKITVDDFPGIKLGAEQHELGFIIDENLRPVLRHGHFIGRLALEYLDTGTDFVKVLVDAADEQHRVIASFKKTDTGRWRRVSMELVNARFVGGLSKRSEVQVVQRPGTVGGVRSMRIDGVHHRCDAPAV